MNSCNLSGFSIWTVWSRTTVEGVPATHGVYVLRMAGQMAFGRLKGTSDIVYIGSSQNMRRRLSSHLSARDDARDIGCRLGRVLRDVGPLELAWKVQASQAGAMLDECKLLARYSSDHIEFPPLNRQETGKRFQYLTRLLKRLPLETQLRMIREAIDLKRNCGISGKQ